MPDCSFGNQVTVNSCLKDASLSELLSSHEEARVHPMDVVLDTFWAIMSECESLNSADLPPHIRNFKDSYGHVHERIKRTRNVRDRYEIVEKIGKGAYGNVYLVKEKERMKCYAMKTISKIQVFRQPENACFMEERLIMGCKDSKWLSHLEEACQDDLFLYLIMEYYGGGDLNSLDPEQQGIDEESAKFYCAEVLLGLEELHKLGYAHRDVKPGNVMLCADGHVRLTDFGSAGKINQEGMIHSKSAVGTPDYISPEALLAQQSRNGATYGPECDWWGLGVLLYELLVGEAPFYAPSLVQTYQNITNHSKYLDLGKFDKLSGNAKDLLKGLLTSPEKRLSLEAIKRHPFFEGIEWDALHLSVPPFVPLLESPEDTSRFYLDEEDDNEFEVIAKKQLKIFEGMHLPFVGYTYDNSKQYRVSFAEQPVLRRIESCQLRMNELEIQVEDLRASCETAKMVSQQLRRITSTDNLSSPSAESADDLRAAHDALLLNYEFLQTHYEDLLSEHTTTSRQLEAMIMTLQEQEDSLKSAEDVIVELKKQKELDRMKINQLVTKLASGLEGLNLNSQQGKEKIVLKQKHQELKHLQQQLYKEALYRQRLEQELADMKASKDQLEKEHEALLLELRPKSAGGPVERMRSILSGGVGHSRHASSVSTLQAYTTLESQIKVLDSKSRKVRWIKTNLFLRDTGLWIGDRESSMVLLASLKAPLFAAQPIQPDELTSSPRNLECCFKIRFSFDIQSYAVNEEVPYNEEELKKQLDKEQRILRGAQHLYDAARSPEQQAIAQSHMEAATRVITDIEAVINNERRSDTQSVLFHGHSLNLPTPSDDFICDGCFKVGASFKCSTCNAVCHPHCQAILPTRCMDAAQLRSVVPAYFKAASPEEARRWLRSIEAARKRS